MDLVTRNDLETIANPEVGGTYVSLFMPTHRAGTEIDADRLRWKNLVQGAEAALLERVRRPEATALLAPARELLDDAMEWQHMSDGLVMYLGPDGHRTLRVPAPMTTLATVGDRRMLAHLLRLLSGDEQFFLLALSRQDVRLLGGSRNTVEDIELGETPRSTEEVTLTDEASTDAVARPVGGRGGPAVFYGHSGSDPNSKQLDVERLFRAVDDGLSDVLRGQSAPMVLVGLEELQVAYREINSYQHLMPAAVNHNADGLSKEELHRLAWPLVERRLQEERELVIERFHELHGTGRVSSDLHEVASAAAEGRVDTLFVRADPWVWDGATDEHDPVVVLGSDERFAHSELVDATAVATLRTGGHVFATSRTVVADSEVAAIFRY